MNPATPALITDRLVLAPLQPDFATEMVEVLADPALYTFTGGSPPTHDELEARYRAQVAGPEDGNEVWHNWVIQVAPEAIAAGFVQATVVGDAADLAWVVGVPWQGHGYASEAALGMRGWLANSGVARFTAHIHPAHVASGRVAAAVGLHPTGEIDSDGEAVWASP